MCRSESSSSSHELLAARSVEVLRGGQSRSGSFVAAPRPRTYRFAWLRDGAFCAGALDAVGDRDAAYAFHRWVAACVERHRALVERAIAALAAAEPPRDELMPPARYTLDGLLERPGPEPWPRFQPDGYAMWLWALRGHLVGGAPAELAPAVELAARYVSTAWRHPSYDCWEERVDEHAATLGAIVAGLRAASTLLDRRPYADDAERVRTRLLERLVRDGRFVRSAGDRRVDGSLLWLGVPFGVLPPDDPRVRATVEAVRTDLVAPDGGVRRYRGDTYYGGGQWILLTCSLGWHDAVAGARDEVERSREWVLAQADARGHLPEQVARHAQAPDQVARWIERWGPSAKPLLWSHAMYLLLEAAARGRPVAA